MVTRESIEDFISQHKIAVVGISNKPQKFGNFAYRQLKNKGYQVFPVGRNVRQIDGDVAYPDVQSLPQKVDGVLIVVPPKETERVVRDANAAGIDHVWMQQGAESPEAIQFCQQRGIKEVHGECILMFAQPVKSYHRVHRFIQGIRGKLPK